MRPCVRASVRGVLGGFGAFVPTSFLDLALSEGFNFGCWEARLGRVRPDPSSGGPFAPVSIDLEPHLGSPGHFPDGVWIMGPGVRALLQSPFAPVSVDLGSHLASMGPFRLGTGCLRERGGQRSNEET